MYSLLSQLNYTLLIGFIRLKSEKELL